MRAKFRRQFSMSIGHYPILCQANLRLAQVSGQDDDVPASEIQERSPFLYLGYLRENGEIDPSRTEDGYLSTSDLGQLVRDSTLVLGGRIRDIIKKGGYYVSLREIEVIAQSHEAVSEATAVDMPHDFYGECYVLFVRLEDREGDIEVSTSDLRNWMTNALSRQKWPEDIVVVEDFPRTPSGKIEKRRLVDAHLPAARK